MREILNFICKAPIRLILLVVVTTLYSCKKLVDTPAPRDRINFQNVFESNESAASVLTGLFIKMSQEGTFTGNSSINLFAGLSSDELTLYKGNTREQHVGYYTNQLKSNVSLTIGAEHWAPLYQYIFQCNTAIEGLKTSKVVTSAFKQQLFGEAKFLRALCYFYLVNLFGDVPLVLNLDYNANTLLGRSIRSEVYQQIIVDLKEADELLSEKYLDGALKPYTGVVERIRPTKWAAKALLARAYLYTDDWINAEITASEVINATDNGSQLFSLPSLNNVFIKNSKEAIWQLQPVTNGQNTSEGKVFIIPSTGLTTGTNSNNPVYLSKMLLDSFETDDNRKKPGNWVDTIRIANTLYYYPFKYKIRLSPGLTSASALKEYFMVLRLSEQFLIRAEARAHQGNISGAKTDVDAIRLRSGLPGVTASSRDSMLTAIHHERQVELFTEWANRWLDIKRKGTVNTIMSIVTPLKANGMGWQSHQQLYPLPFNNLQYAPNLIQNSGYN